jgi:hypothetical protein
VKLIAPKSFPSRGSRLPAELYQAAIALLDRYPIGLVSPELPVPGIKVEVVETITGGVSCWLAHTLACPAKIFSQLAHRLLTFFIRRATNLFEGRLDRPSRRKVLVIVNERKPGR